MTMSFQRIDVGHLRRRQRNYNTKLVRNCYLAEHYIRILKQKFRQLFHVKLRNIPDITHFIRARCVLYYLVLDDNFPYKGGDMVYPQRNIEEMYNLKRDNEKA
ncbi:hypothetical protein NQ314_010769 [Rhamnusium bicolor]|uniref:DDE Tnp4 domain-containing protein n=1 Tax=Rhamnusium bicolor TaxID=1586634 RepID=A0AAV8XNY5_9CUCU|nr:hypothetical protein NQ314_010769 [Rhamnusium bicolor]